jgi:hypothetical protein
MRRLQLTLAAAVLAVSAGCAVSSSPPPRERPRGVEDSHTCIGACDHFFVDGGWVVEPGHKHGPNCGHHLINGKWKKDKPADKDGDDRPKDKKD